MSEVWIFVGIAVVSAAVGYALFRYGKIGKDHLIQLVAKCSQLVRKAEKLYPEQGSGSTKKAYVLSFLEELFEDVSDKLLGALIDLLVAILNATAWW